MFSVYSWSSSVEKRLIFTAYIARIIYSHVFFFLSFIISGPGFLEHQQDVIQCVSSVKFVLNVPIFQKNNMFT